MNSSSFERKEDVIASTSDKHQERRNESNKVVKRGFLCTNSTHITEQIGLRQSSFHVLILSYNSCNIPRFNFCLCAYKALHYQLLIIAKGLIDSYLLLLCRPKSESVFLDSAFSIRSSPLVKCNLLPSSLI
jgi:hypothetical protein